jgi:hypothetical protein
MNILWISRHDIDPKQRIELINIYGEHKLIHARCNIKDLEDILDLVKQHDAQEIVAILPIKLYQELANKGFKIIKPIMKREKTALGISFQFSHFEKIDKVEVVSRKL